MALSLESSLLRTFLTASSFAALPLRTKEVDIPYFVQTSCPDYWRIWNRRPHILPSHLSVSDAYGYNPSDVCPREYLERDVLDERDSVYLYVISLCTELDRFCLLAPYDRAYVMTVNTDNTVTDLPAFKEFLFLYKDLSDDGKPFLIILCICE